MQVQACLRHSRTPDARGSRRRHHRDDLDHTGFRTSIWSLL